MMETMTMNVKPEELIFNPNVGLGPFLLETFTKKKYARADASIGSEFKNEYGEICFDVEIRDLDIQIRIVEGLVDHVSTYSHFYYDGVNLIGTPIPEVKRIFSDYRWNTEPVWTPYDDGTKLLMHDVDNIGLILDESEDGLVWSCMCFKEEEDDD